MNSSVTKKNGLKVKDPMLSRVLIVQNTVYAAVLGVIGEDRLQETCSFPLGNHPTVILTDGQASYGCSRGLRLTLPVSKLLDKTSLFLFPVNVFRPKFAAAGLPTNLRNAQLAGFFSALFFLLVGSGPKKSTPIEKMVVPRWFLPYFKEQENCAAARGSTCVML